VEVTDERPQRPLLVITSHRDQLTAFLPGGHDSKRGDADQQRQPCPAHQLGQIGGEEQKVDGEQEGGGRRDDPPWPVPLMRATRTPARLNS
jgi:hypothetical protein